MCERERALDRIDSLRQGHIRRGERAGDLRGASSDILSTHPVERTCQLRRRDMSRDERAADADTFDAVTVVEHVIANSQDNLRYPSTQSVRGGANAAVMNDATCVREQQVIGSARHDADVVTGRQLGPTANEHERLPCRISRQLIKALVGSWQRRPQRHDPGALAHTKRFERRVERRSSP